MVENAISVLMIPILLKKMLEYVDSIMQDINWLGFQWDNLYYASDYFG